MPGWIGVNWSIQPSSQLSLLLGAENIEVGLADVVLVDVGAQLPLLPHDTCTGVAKDGTTDCGNTAQFHLQALEAFAPAAIWTLLHQLRHSIIAGSL